MQSTLSRILERRKHKNKEVIAGGVTFLFSRRISLFMKQKEVTTKRGKSCTLL
jgi:hypothetical protein